MKRTFIGGVTAALIAIAGLTFAGQQAQEPRQGGGPGFGRGGPGRGGPGGFARLADLTDEQRQQVRAILEEDRESRQGPPPAATLHRQLEAALLADAPDDQAIEALRQQIVQAQGEALSRQIALQRKIAQVLTPEQRAAARQRLSEAPAARGGRGERRGEAHGSRPF